MFAVKITKKILNKYTKQNKLSILNIQTIFMEFQLKYQREDVLVKSLNAKKNIVNATVLDLNVLKIVTAVIAIIVNLKLIMIILTVAG